MTELAGHPLSYNGGAYKALASGVLGARGEALAVFCRFGPAYNRSAAESVADAGLWAGRGHHDLAERALLKAEFHAKVRGWDETAALMAAIEGRLL